MYICCRKRLESAKGKDDMVIRSIRLTGSNRHLLPVAGLINSPHWRRVFHKRVRGMQGTIFERRTRSGCARSLQLATRTSVHPRTVAYFTAAQRRPWAQDHWPCPENDESGYGGRREDRIADLGRSGLPHSSLLSGDCSWASIMAWIFVPIPTLVRHIGRTISPLQSLSRMVCGILQLDGCNHDRCRFCPTASIGRQLTALKAGIQAARMSAFDCRAGWSLSWARALVSLPCVFSCREVAR